MVRSYVRKTKKGDAYTKEQLLQATNAITSKQMTLYDHINKRRGMKSTTKGRNTALSPAVEKSLAQSLTIMEKYGHGLSRTEVLTLVGNYVNDNNLVTPFKGGYPGHDWWIGFSSRHKLSLKKPQVVENARKKACDPFIIYNYFDLLWETMTDLGIVNRPDRIWNLDETSFCLDPSKTKTVGPIGQPSTRTTHGSGRDNTSVLMACSADGKKGPPLIIFKGKNIWDRWITQQSEFPDTTYAATSNGWMEREVFVNYFEKSFLKTTNPSPANPILLIYDGHSSHVDLKLVEIARNNNVTIILLPPHSSHLLQPMDLSVFKSIKTVWDQRLCSWNRSHQGQKLPKQDLSRIICSIWAQLDTKIIENGFRKAGIYPFNRNAVDKSKFDPISLSRWEVSNTQENNQTTDDQTSTTEMYNDLVIYNEASTSTCIASNNNFNSNQASTSTEKNAETEILNNSKSFEELLLISMKQVAVEKTTRKQVTSGATVITSEEVINILKAKEQEKDKPKNNKKKKQSEEVVNEEVVNEEEIQDVIDINLNQPNENLNISFVSGVSEISDLLNELEREEEDLAEEGYMFRTKNCVDDWVLIKYKLEGKSAKSLHYVGIIKEVFDGKHKIKFVKLKSENKHSTTFVYPIADDIDEVSESDIICSLPKPTIGRRGQLVFGITFSQYNLKK
ncbi:uncharacterized protein LOC100569966 isoform X2 [Acyrthosiphon pisum]|uniref:DDE-1 domain-containing protein n=1 Tax=Acyrthosiphon pisum TaxID=7029 RepID=A0A8R2JPE6_ACYPI|nr:uncharacterized protein LOC100569966 isoform X2 [Acyrthosiphon pisum]